jgi:hypothetical protein
MKKLICKYFGHKFRWVIAHSCVACIRCHADDVMSLTISDVMINFLKKGKRKVLKSY